MNPIFYYIYDLPNATTPDEALIQTVTAVSGFTPLLLAFVFFFVLIVGSSSQKTRTGTADVPMWSVVASLSTLLIGLLMTIKEGLIRVEWLVIVAVVTIFCGVWFFISQRASEV